MKAYRVATLVVIAVVVSALAAHADFVSDQCVWMIRQPAGSLR